MITKEAQVTSPGKSKELADKAIRGSSIFEWIKQIDQHGSLNILDERFGGHSICPAYTVAELLEMLPAMGTITFLVFCFRTRLKPDAVADYVMREKDSSIWAWMIALMAVIAIIAVLIVSLFSH